MERTGKPIAAGILNIIAGGLGILSAISIMLGLGVLGWFEPFNSEFVLFGFVLMLVAVLTLPVALLALVGGAFDLQRKHWGWALAGSIAAILAFWPLGIASTVLTAQSKGEFE